MHALSWLNHCTHLYAASLLQSESKRPKTYVSSVNNRLTASSLLQGESDESLEASVTDVFRDYGKVWVKVRRDHKNMPFAFCQYTVGSVTQFQSTQTEGVQTIESAERAILEGNGRMINGRPCRCEQAKAHRKSPSLTIWLVVANLDRHILYRAQVWCCNHPRRSLGSFQLLRRHCHLSFCYTCRTCHA